MSKETNPEAPQCLEAALDAGWRIQEALSTWDFTGSNKREGFLFLTRKGSRKGSKTLIVPFSALYELRKPYFLESNGTAFDSVS